MSHDSLPANLDARLRLALQQRGPDYIARTRHKDEDGTPQFVNQLILEDSPYLLQHAHNPVNWYAWSAQAFAAAREQNKPIFLSIGYATCHWCHVMEEECFENTDIAALLNEHFISIKVDREQRPDVDNYYMTGVMLIAGQGGWPLSSFLTPDGEPFFAGTYYPPPQFAHLLRQIVQTWQDNRQGLVEQGTRVAEAITASNGSRQAADALPDDLSAQACQSFLRQHDNQLGGFGRAPKFPMEPALLLMLDQAARNDAGDVLNSVGFTLQAMADGGLHDQIGGGFHRYSVDNQWLVPHFEKMLYNQAHLGRCYLQAWQLTGAGFFRRVAEQLLTYVLRDLQAPEGGFYSATDADSEGEEGRFFVWTPEQIRAALPESLAERALHLYAVNPDGNFEGRSIPYLPVSLTDYARQNQLELGELLKELDSIRELLYQQREQREHPVLDNKIIVGWNGMTITTLAQASDVLDDPRYLAAAARAAERLWLSAQREDGRLWRIILNGKAGIPALQEDYAYFAEACLALYDTSGEADWLHRAESLVQVMVEDFADPAGGFYMNPAQSEPPLPRLKDVMDSAIPSGNSVALRVLARLYRRTGKDSYRQQADALVAALAAQVQQNPTAFAYLLMALDEYRHGEVGKLQYAGNGVVRVHAHCRGEKVIVGLYMQPGWHVNIGQPQDPALLATSMEVVEPDNCHLDDISSSQPGAPDACALEGNAIISGRLRGASPQRFKLRLDLQPCSQDHCLAPETLILSVAVQTAHPAGG